MNQPIIERDGFAIIPEVLGVEQQKSLKEVLGNLSSAGRRDLLGIPEVAKLARSEKLLNLLRPHLPAEPFPVRSIYFNKSAETNWLVPWHQDVTLAVRERVETPGFGAWSVKQDQDSEPITHVQAPAEYLEQMITIRLHLDPADETNGALRVLAGTHHHGRLSAEQIQAFRQNEPEHLCTVSAGDAMLMRPLILHASSRSTSTKHRRVLHLEYACRPLPGGLEWHES